MNEVCQLIEPCLATEAGIVQEAVTLMYALEVHAKELGLELTLGYVAYPGEGQRLSSLCSPRPQLQLLRTQLWPSPR